MAFGDLLGTLTGNGLSVTNPSDSSGSVVVSVGDLVIAVMGQQTALTVTAVTDNLGNSYSAQNAGTDAGNATGRMFYSRVTVAGTLTVLHFAATASANNYSVIGAVFAGSFTAPPIDANPANAASDITSPFTCPATGTLAQADELVIGWCTGGAAAVADWVGTAPNTLQIQAVDTGGAILSVIGSQVVAATTTVTPEFTGSAPNNSTVPGTASFKKTPVVFTYFDLDICSNDLVRYRPEVVGY